MSGLTDRYGSATSGPPIKVELSTSRHIKIENVSPRPIKTENVRSRAIKLENVSPRPIKIENVNPPTAKRPRGRPRKTDVKTEPVAGPSGAPTNSRMSRGGPPNMPNVGSAVPARRIIPAKRGRPKKVLELLNTGYLDQLPVEAAGKNKWSFETFSEYSSGDEPPVSKKRRH